MYTTHYTGGRSDLPPANHEREARRLFGNRHGHVFLPRLSPAPPGGGGWSQ